MPDKDSNRRLSQDLRVAPLGVSCGAVGVADEPALGPDSTDDQRFLDCLRRAIALGATLFDTADWHGHGRAERLLGRILREYPNRGLVVGSKVGRLRGSAPHPYADRRIHHQLQQTTKNLYVEAVDLYCLDSWDFGPQDCYLHAAVAQVQTLRELGDIKALGLRGPYLPYGASAADRAAVIRRFVHLFHLIGPDVIWCRFNALTPSICVGGEDLLSFTARHGVGVVLAAPRPRNQTAPGLCLPGVPTGADEKAWPSPLLPELGDEAGDEMTSLEQMALRWCLQRARHCAAVVECTNTDHVEQAFAHLAPALTTAELALADETYDCAGRPPGADTFARPVAARVRIPSHRPPTAAL
ncbi:aldo/keto reductase [Streptomyces chrestomyceticus]|uniref:aldo/keto reductase n=1 Tax=Streptomyces chrestomyceticus TaxID=68185 RepID=UPI0036C58EA9